MLLKKTKSPFFVVRWVGYEDEFNTLEPLDNVEQTSMYKLFTLPNIYTASRSMGGSVLRRSKRINLQMESDMCVVPEATSVVRAVGLTECDKAIAKLTYLLKLQENAGNYMEELGFCSYKNVSAALEAQHRFFIKEFIPLIQNLKSGLYLDPRYIGEICGNLHKAAEFKAISAWGVKRPDTIRNYIQSGLKQARQAGKDRPNFVAFLVPQKHGTTEKKTKKVLNMHMCVYIVREHEGLKDAIYYNPDF